ncbi:hypothetical protein ON010_g13685 [Phytophthora cinnamomi]|nr:hypothetical protein ON010_g13685 [Phytophthora cinnamomi]
MLNNDLCGGAAPTPHCISLLSPTTSPIASDNTDSEFSVNQVPQDLSTTDSALSTDQRQDGTAKTDDNPVPLKHLD